MAGFVPRGRRGRTRVSRVLPLYVAVRPAVRSVPGRGQRLMGRVGRPAAPAGGYGGAGRARGSAATIPAGGGPARGAGTRLPGRLTPRHRRGFRPSGAGAAHRAPAPPVPHRHTIGDTTPQQRTAEPPRPIMPRRAPRRFRNRRRRRPRDAIPANRPARPVNDYRPARPADHRRPPSYRHMDPGMCPRTLARFRRFVSSALRARFQRATRRPLVHPCASLRAFRMAAWSSGRQTWRCRGVQRCDRPRLSTACGGGDAVVGGVEQCHRGHGSRSPLPRAAPGGRPTAVGRPRSAVGRRRLAARRDQGPARRPRRLPGARSPGGDAYGSANGYGSGSGSGRRTTGPTSASRLRPRVRPSYDRPNGRPAVQRSRDPRTQGYGSAAPAPPASPASPSSAGAAPATPNCGSACSPPAAAPCATSPPGPAATPPSLQLGRRITVLGDLAGARPVFHTRWSGGTAYATAALPLADLIEAGLDVTHLAATLACPDAPEALGDGTPYLGVRRVPPGHALILRDGAPEITGYEPDRLPRRRPPAVQPRRTARRPRRAYATRCVDAVRAPPRPSPRFVSPTRAARAPGARHRRRPVRRHRLRHPRPARRRAARHARHPARAPARRPGERLLAVTFNDLAGGGPSPARPNWSGPARIAADPRLHHLVVTGGDEALPVRRPGRGPAHRRARPLPRRRRTPPAAARRGRRRPPHRLRRPPGPGRAPGPPRRPADGPPPPPPDTAGRRAGAGGRAAPRLAPFAVPCTVYRAARRLARTPYQQGVEDVAALLLRADVGRPPAEVRPGPARWAPRSPRWPGSGPGPRRAG